MPSSPRPSQIDFGGAFARPPRATLALMVLTGVVSLVTIFDLGHWGSGGYVYRLVQFSPSQVLDSWKVWTPFTYQFVSVSPFGLILYELLLLWMFAAPLERQWGPQRFLYFFFGTSTGAAVLTTLLGMWLSPLRLAPVDGTWVATEAVVLGWVLMNWYSTVYFFVIPVRAPFLLVMSLGVPALYILTGSWVPFVTPLLGMGIGFLMLKQNLSPRRAWLHLRAWWIDRSLKRRARHLRVVPPPEKDRDREPKGPRYLN